MMLKCICIISFLIISTLNLTSQILPPAQQLDNSSGLSNSSINYVFQDSDDLLWVGSWDGLNAYDGTEFHVFNYDNRKGALLSNVIRQVREDKKKNIWLATEQGISKYNKATGNFDNYFYNKQKKKLDVISGFSVAIDQTDDIYAIPRFDNVFYKYNADKNKFDLCKVKQLNTDKVVKFEFDKYNRLWILSANGQLEILQKKGNDFESLKIIRDKAGINSFFIDSIDFFYSTLSNKLFRVNNKLDSSYITTLPHQLYIMTSFKDHYLMAWPYKGMQEYDRNFKPISSLLKTQPALQNMRITDIKRNKQNDLWIGTDGSGVIYIPNTINRFGSVNTLPNKLPFNISVRAFCEIGDELWVGTRGNGIIKYRNFGKSNMSSSYIQSNNSNFDFFNNSINAIVKAKSNLVYIGSDDYGITLYDTQKDKFITWEQIKESKKHPPFNSIQCILVDDDQSIWAGSLNGLYHIKLKKDLEGNFSISSFDKYNYDGTNTGLANNVIYSLAKGKNKNLLYIGCRYGGLSVLNISKNTFTTFKASAYPGSLSNNDVLSLHYDNKNRLWIGTSFGLNWINTDDLTQQKPKFSILNVEQGLPNNTIHAITNDDKNSIWISTNKGLAQVYPAEKKITQFKMGDGLQSNEFSDNAVYKSSEGYILFGGIFGFNYLLPQNVNLTNDEPNLVITDFTIADKEINAHGLTIINANKQSPIAKFEVPPEASRFDLKLNPLEFTSQGKTQYYYLLEGLDQKWQLLKEGRRITYSHIPPGNYTLKIKTSNSNNDLQTKTLFKLKAKQYIWLTTSAFIVYGILFLLSIYLFYLYDKNKLILNHKLSVEKILRTKDKELHQEQLNFFTNIAHELQTPLTLLGSALEQYNSKNEKKDFNEYQRETYLSIASQQSNRLNHLAYQLLEFRKAEAGHLKCFYSQYNISNHLTSVVNLFKPLSANYKFTFHASIAENIESWMDRDKFEKIIFNLLSNAFKHTSENNEIQVKATVNHSNQHLEIAVANSGANLSEDQLKDIFKKFHVLNHHRNNTGIGLAFAKELSIMLKSELTVSSANNWIVFKLSVPLNYIPSPDQIATVSNTHPSDLFYSLRGIDAEHEQSDKKIAVANNAAALLNVIEKKKEKSILIVDDEPSMRFILRDILQEHYVVFEANNGKDAIQMMHAALPNLILSDVTMPDMDGFGLCDIAKNTPETCHIPFILLSAKGDVTHQTVGYEAGADAYIAKPFNTDLLLVRIKQLLNYQDKIHSLFNAGQTIPEDASIKAGDKKFITNIHTIINDYLDHSTLDAEFLEQKLGMSKMSLYRKVKSIFNMTPVELIKNSRLQQSATMLQTSDLTVTEIFYKSGFNNESYFYREFKKKYNLSPNEYRTQQHLPSKP